MRKIFTIVMIGFALSGQAQEAEQIVVSKIDQVTVFLQGAQITRQAETPLKNGVTSLKFSSIAPGIQDQSIQVEGPPGVKILSVSYHVNYLDEIKKPEKIESLRSEQLKLQNLLAHEKSMIEVYRQEEAILMTNKSIGGDTKGVLIDELKIAMDYFRQRLIDIRQLLLKADQTIRDYQNSLTKIDNQLTELQASKALPTGEIIVKVSSQKAATSAFTLRYVVKQAGWFPSYDIRAKDVQSPINITYKANINQQSGEDWSNVKLTISSGNPSAGGSSPVLKAWYLGFNNIVTRQYAGLKDKEAAFPGIGSNGMIRGRIVDSENHGIPGANVLIKGTTVGTATDEQGYYSLPLTGDAQTIVISFIGYASEEVSINNNTEINARLEEDVTKLDEVVVIGYGTNEDAVSGRLMGVSSQPKVKKSIVATPVIRQTNIEYTLDESFTVKSDGEMRTTEMMEYELDAIYQYYCVPKMDADAFLTAKVLHWDEYNFLEGEASLFFEGKYIGKSVLDTRITSDTLTLSLGRDGNVMVKREKKKEYSSRQFVGTNQKATLAYEISVRNRKPQPISIIILDQVPVSNTREVVIDKQEDSKADYEQSTGLLKWRKDILPGKTEIVSFKYAVRYPKGNSMILE